ncbi:MAG: hypothetical protein WC884_00940 [Candidatus Paceibacterota bacterium]
MEIRLWKDDRGQDLIEYSLMAAFVAMAAMAIIPGLSQFLSGITGLETIWFRLAGTILAVVSLGALILHRMKLNAFDDEE